MNNYLYWDYKKLNLLRFNFLRNIFVIIFFVCTNSCNSPKGPFTFSKSYDTLYVSEKTIDKMSTEEAKQMYIDTGNDIYYRRFSTYYIENNFLYRLISTNKYEKNDYNFYFESFSGFFPRLKSGILCMDSLDKITANQLISRMKAAAEAGDGISNIYLAEMYMDGNGVVKDESKAKELIIKATELGKRERIRREKNEIYIDRYGIKYKFIHDKIEKQVDNNSTSSITTCCIQPFADSIDQRKICRLGDIQAYKRMKELYKSKGVEREVIFYSIVMANRYNYPPAYFDIYMCLWKAFNGGKKADLWDMTRFDIKSKEFAMFYLKKAVVSGNQQAREIIMKQY